MKKYISLTAVCILFIACNNRGLFAANTESPGKYLFNTYNDTARFMAGKELNQKSALAEFTADKGYLRYKSAIDKSWETFLVENMKNIRVWRNTHLPKKYDSTVFYPFSGPDVLHPLTFFSDAKDIIMFGLEPVGEIPDPVKLKKGLAVRYLWGIPAALNFTLKHAFFVTLDMGKKIGSNPYTGITGVMMFFLAREGYIISDVKKIWIDRKPEVVLKKPAGAYWNSVPGVEILFKKDGESSLRRVRFFRLDISDRSRQLPVFSGFMKKGPMYTTIIKSASYLMHHKSGFTKISSQILEKSNSILQDDSGMPHRLFSDKIWNISYHGYYHKPLKVFKMHYQKDLMELVKKNSSGPLPFKYGYGYGFDDMTYHIIYAERKERALNNSRID